MRNIFLSLWFIIPFNLFGQDWPDLNRYRDDNAKLGSPATNESRIVFMGNSITEGWSNFHPDFFSLQLCKLNLFLKAFQIHELAL